MTTPPPAEEAPSWPDLPDIARQVLLEVLIHGAMPRSEIAARLHLSRPTLTRVTRKLIAERLLAEGDTQLRTPLGRPSELLRARAQAHHFLGMKLTADRLHIAVTDLTATLVEATDEPLGSSEPEAVVAQIADVAARYPYVTALGVTLGARVLDGLVIHDAYLRWSNLPLKTELTRATGLPTVVGNDVQALTAAEHWFGGGAGLRSMAVVTIGSGIGTGLIVNGELVHGARGQSPRFHHLLVDSAGPPCDAGHSGCVSSYVTTPMLLRRLDGQPTYEEALDRFRRGDSQARRVFGDAGYALGVLIGVVANAIDPEKVLVTGDGLPLYEFASSRVYDGVRATYENDLDLLRLDAQPFEFTEWARSSAALAINAAIQGTS